MKREPFGPPMTEKDHDFCSDMACDTCCGRCYEKSHLFNLESDLCVCGNTTKTEDFKAWEKSAMSWGTSD